MPAADSTSSAPTLDAAAPNGAPTPFAPGELPPTVGYLGVAAGGAPGLPAVPGYRLLRELGRGGMGVVYQALQEGLGRPVALKMMLHGAFASPQMLERFRREAKATAELRHPHIVPVHTWGEDGERCFFAMELIEGPSLADRLRTGPIPSQQAARLLKPLAEAVAHAHAQGLLHRDLKPANILLDATEKPWLTDFGLTKRLDGGTEETATGAVLGTPSHMAPEQADGRGETTKATDVYGLGAVLYSMLTGRPPFQAESALETIAQVLRHDPAAPRLVNPNVLPDLEAICLKCLRKDPAGRYASADELAEDLGRFLDGSPVNAKPPNMTDLAGVWWRKHLRTLLTLAGVGSVGGVVMTALLRFAANLADNALEPTNLALGIIGAGVSVVAAVCVLFAVGFLGARLAGTSRRDEDLAAGLGAGGVCLLFALMFGFGPVLLEVSLATARLESAATLGVLTGQRGDWTQNPEALRARFPEVAAAEPAEREVALLRSARRRLDRSLHEGVTIGLSASFVAFLALLPFGAMGGLGWGMYFAPRPDRRRTFFRSPLTRPLLLRLFVALAVGGAIIDFAPAFGVMPIVPIGIVGFLFPFYLMLLVDESGMRTGPETVAPTFWPAGLAVAVSLCLIGWRAATGWTFRFIDGVFIAFGLLMAAHYVGLKIDLRKRLEVPCDKKR